MSAWVRTGWRETGSPHFERWGGKGKGRVLDKALPPGCVIVQVPRRVFPRLHSRLIKAGVDLVTIGARYEIVAGSLEALARAEAALASARSALRKG